MKLSTTKRIKICHFANIITGRADGVYAHLKMLLTSLDITKFEQILIFHGGEKVKNEISSIGIKVYAIPELNSKISFNAFLKFYKICNSEDVDIIHCHLVKPYIIAGITNLFMKKKFIFNYHGIFINSFYYKEYEKLLFRLSHYLINFINTNNIAIVPSETSAKILSRETNLFSKILVYYNGSSEKDKCKIDNATLRTLKELSEKHFVIGIIARLEIEKRIDLALQIALESLKSNENIFFAFLGDGSLEEKLKKLAISMHVNDRVKFFGFVENAEFYIEYFNLLLLTSDREGLPLSIWESMAAGVPIIASDVGGAKEILERENCGFVYSRGDYKSAIELIIKLKNDKKLTAQLGKNGKEAIALKYNLNHFKSFFENLYSNI